MSTTLILIQLVVFISYIAAILFKFKKVPSSISESYYLLEKRGWIFTIWLSSIGIILCLYGNVLLFVSGIALCFTAVAAQYKESLTNKVHYIGAAGGYGVALLVINPIIVGAIVALLVLANLYKINNKIFWLEVMAFFIITLGLIMV